MLRAIIWRDLRWRLLATLTLVAPIAALVAWSFVAQRPPGMSHADYVDIAWFWVPGPGAVLLPVAVMLAAGASLVRPRNDLAYLLALPVSRRRWVVMHAAMSLAALVVVIVTVDVVLAAGALRAGEPIALARYLSRSLAAFAAASVWVGVTLGALALVRHAVLAATLVMGAVVMLPTSRFQLEMPLKPPSPMLSGWDPWALADPRSWQDGVPTASLAVAIALGAAGMILAIARVERFEP